MYILLYSTHSAIRLHRGASQSDQTLVQYTINDETFMKFEYCLIRDIYCSRCHCVAAVSCHLHSAPQHPTALYAGHCAKNDNIGMIRFHQVVKVEINKKFKALLG